MCVLDVRIAEMKARVRGTALSDFSGRCGAWAETGQHGRWDTHQIIEIAESILHIILEHRLTHFIQETPRMFLR